MESNLIYYTKTHQFRINLNTLTPKNFNTERMSKQRHYYNITGKNSATGQIEYTQRPLVCDDKFEQELVMLAFPIKMLEDISPLLKNFKLRDDAAYFLVNVKK